MENIMDFVLQVGIILVVGEVLGVISQKLKMPKVLGFLLSGIVIGPSMFNIVHENEPIKVLAQIGVIFLMFMAGLETDIEKFKTAGMSSFIIAIGGIVVPFLLGTVATYLFTGSLTESIFVGVILTATSVAITVQTLNELGKLNTRASINIIGAAIIDDILGIIILSVAIMLVAPSASDAASATGLLLILGKILIFIILSGILLKFLPGIIEKSMENGNKKSKTETLILIIAGLTILFSIFVEEALGIAAITGAYVIGLVIALTKYNHTFEDKFSNVSTYLVSPIFFSSIGLTLNIKTLGPEVILPIIVISIAAILGKIIGCSGAAKLYGLSSKECTQIGVGMISRGEVAIITATLGLSKGIITKDMYPTLLVVIIITTIVTPLLLKIVFSEKDLNKSV
ncbi:cation:proton antiporter [Clostridium cylindrosporum]|uniref:Putative Na(+)/H(+) antiporter GerT n=1 Tax=Clostridium cylindrosporum DSM 605 TaxID=1121307 RepID=A0A0J8D9W7_CLOCY|nr:cation:proton antiporter [Clostridium cylindrosporum]KMT21104.1 putative Na(+)/H(+) antiporter GerT [Clostridium cylindrosporum DSM 605]